MERIKKILKFVLNRIYNSSSRLEKLRANINTGFDSYDEIAKRAIYRNDISDHLVPLFFESLQKNPNLIVELGVRGGDSTFVLERVAKLCNSNLVSIDIENCSNISNYSNWHFVQKDDIAFADDFVSWCGKNNLPKEIDLLLVDTSHLYKHTVQEIKKWFPFLSPSAKVVFHDTNMGWLYFRNDGSLGGGWNNKRGVIRAIEEYFDEKFDEKHSFTVYRNDWLIKHYANCSGFTVLEKIPPALKN